MGDYVRYFLSDVCSTHSFLLVAAVMLAPGVLWLCIASWASFSASLYVIISIHSTWIISSFERNIVDVCHFDHLPRRPPFHRLVHHHYCVCPSSQPFATAKSHCVVSFRVTATSRFVRSTSPTTLGHERVLRTPAEECACLNQLKIECD